jgi:uncharacterized protein
MRPPVQIWPPRPMSKNFLFILLFGIGITLFVTITKILTTTQKSAHIGAGTFTLEIADTETLREQGLSDRNTMASDHGMLFVFSSPGIQTFWMKDMHFPLDFVWIREGKIIDLTENVPAPEPGQPLGSLPVYNPKEPVDQVIELNAGSIRRFAIHMGDTVSL